MKKLLIILIICSLYFLLQGNVATGDVEEKDNCLCQIVIECYHPGYMPGDLSFASQTVNSCAKAKEYMEYISQTSEAVFFYLHPAEKS